MKDYATEFYKSAAWKSCRDAYMASRSHLCEECMREGRYTLAEIVHHIIPITEENINDPNVTLSWSNLRAVCRECHAAAHGARVRRYKVDTLYAFETFFCNPDSEYVRTGLSPFSFPEFA